MKRVTVAAVAALVFAIAIGSTVQAGNRMGGMGGGCGNCSQTEASIPADQLRKFQLDTLDLRQEMMIKRFEVQRENLKAVPDQAKLGTLQEQIKEIQSRINDIQVKSGLPDKTKRNGDCGSMGGCGKCQKMNSGCDGGGTPCGSR